MALSYVDTDGTLVIPQANAKWTTAPSNSGIATSGVIVLVGEADQGPAYSEEADLTQNFFGPNQLGAVLAKYGSGNLVESFNIASNPSKDPGVRGSPSSIFLVKTNAGTKAAGYVPTVTHQVTCAGVQVNDTVTVTVGGSSVVFTAKAAPAAPTEFDQSGSDTACAASLAAKISAYGLAPLTTTSATSALGVVTVASAQNFALTSSNGTRLAVSGVIGSYAQFQAKLAGTPGNLIYFSVTTPVAGKRTITVSRQSDGKTETFTVGGNIAITAKSAAATDFTVGATTITSAGSGVTVQALNITKSQFTTIGDLVAFINSQTGWTASVLPAFKQMSPSVLDQGVVADASAGSGAQVKKDAYEFVTAIGNSVLVAIKGTAPVTGLPSNTATSIFLNGGQKGTTSDANVQAALAACEQVRCNSVVTLFSQDATADFAAGLTESGSTYTIAGVNAYNTDHVSRMSQFKRRRPRQAFESFRGSFADAKTAAQTQAYFRTAMAFEDCAALSVSGGVKWYQPWMVATLAAAMQMAAFYKPLFNKAIACSGVVQNAGDFKPGDDSQVEDALLAGLLVVRQRDDGAYAFISDQTTYSADQNFVYNSIQAIYVADTISMTVALRMEKAFVGQSFADVTASVAMSYLKSIMADLKRLKLICASDDAVDGYKNAKIEISAPSMLVSAEIKEATGLYFIPISFLITQVQQTATA